MGIIEKNLYNFNTNQARVRSLELVLHLDSSDTSVAKELELLKMRQLLLLELLNTLNHREKEVLETKFIKGNNLRWQELANRIHLSYSYTRAVYNNAIKKLEEFCNEVNMSSLF